MSRPRDKHWSRQGAAVKSGAAYVPMDPGYPVARLAMMAEDARGRLIVTDDAAGAASPSVEKTVRRDAAADDLAAGPDAAPGIAVGPGSASASGPPPAPAKK